MKSKTLTLLFVVTLIQQLDIFTHKGNRTWASRGGFACLRFRCVSRTQIGLLHIQCVISRNS